MTDDAERQELWTGRAKAILEDALARIDDDQIFIELSAAEACLLIGAGELDPSELDGYPFPGEETDETGCTCPPELAARGGFRSDCPVHGSWWRRSR